MSRRLLSSNNGTNDPISLLTQDLLVHILLFISVDVRHGELQTLRMAAMVCATWYHTVRQRVAPELLCSLLPYTDGISLFAPYVCAVPILLRLCPTWISSPNGICRERAPHFAVFQQLRMSAQSTDCLPIQDILTMLRDMLGHRTIDGMSDTAAIALYLLMGNIDFDKLLGAKWVHIHSPTWKAWNIVTAIADMYALRLELEMHSESADIRDAGSVTLIDVQRALVQVLEGEQERVLPSMIQPAVKAGVSQGIFDAKIASLLYKHLDISRRMDYKATIQINYKDVRKRQYRLIAQKHGSHVLSETKRAHTWCKHWMINQYDVEDPDYVLSEDEGGSSEDWSEDEESGGEGSDEESDEESDEGSDEEESGASVSDDSRETSEDYSDF